MSLFKPLVIDPNNETPLKQLQGQDDLDIPLRQRMDELEENLNTLCVFLVAQGLDVPDELVKD